MSNIINRLEESKKLVDNIKDIDSIISCVGNVCGTVCSDINNTISKVDGTISKVDGTISKIDGTISKIDGTISKIGELVDKSLSESVDFHSSPTLKIKSLEVKNKIPFSENHVLENNNGNKVSSYLSVSKQKCTDIKSDESTGKVVFKKKVDIKKGININKEVNNSNMDNKSKISFKKVKVDKKLVEISSTFGAGVLNSIEDSKKDDIASAATLYATDLINFDEIKNACDSCAADWRGCIYTINVDCHNKKLGTTRNGMPIFPRNFLDNTFIVGTTYSTNSHQLFRKEFLSVLEKEIPDLHVRFEKDREDPLLFTIKFYNRREMY
jgi:hypothetical protein